MSDASEVKRWNLSQLDRLSSNSWSNPTFVSSQDHDRIVAELKAGTANALKRVFNRQIGFLVSANAFRVLCEEIEKYDPFFKMPNSSERRRFVADRNAEMQNLKETIARQARVIEKLKERLTSWISETHPNDEHLRNMCLMVEERELAAIEKEGEEK